MDTIKDTIVQFSGLKCGSYDYTFELGNDFFAAFKNENLNAGEVVFQVKLEKMENLLVFHFDFQGKVSTVCDRCLDDIEVPVSGEQTLYVKFSDEEVSDNEDVVYLPSNEYKIELAQWMYEYVVVAMPMQCVHPDDENGNPTCNPEMMKYITTDSEEPSKEMDSRWSELAKLK